MTMWCANLLRLYSCFVKAPGTDVDWERELRDFVENYGFIWVGLHHHTNRFCLPVELSILFQCQRIRPYLMTFLKIFFVKC